MREVSYDLDRNIERQRIFDAAMSSIATQLSRTPVLYGPNDKPLPPRITASSGNQYSRKSAQRTGTMTNWIPKRLIDPRMIAQERERIVERCVELCQDNPWAAGIKETLAVTVVGPGLIPQPEIDSEFLGLSKDEDRAIRAQQRAIWRKWSPWADVGGRMTIAGIQFLLEANNVQYGEHVMLPRMLNKPWRPYALACQVINPMRLKTPTDKYSDGNIRDGIELDKDGAATHYWIKKTTIGTNQRWLPDTSKNFVRIPARVGHRLQVIHQFVNDDAEQIRGYSKFAPSLKLFQDLNDLLDAELVSSIVTAAFSMFIELSPGQDGFGYGNNMPGWNEYGTDRDSGSSTRKVRYQEIIPGGIMYGETGEKPHTIDSNRPGTTFDPFAQIILKAIAGPVGVPYAALFKDNTKISFAGWRGAMLEAWRTYMFRRSHLGQGSMSPIRRMLLEEAYLRGELTVHDFYTNTEVLCAASWQGYPKGDIEPVKAAQADVLLHNNKMKTLETIAAERGTTAEALIAGEAEENRMRENAALAPRQQQSIVINNTTDEKNEETDDET